MKKIVLLTAFIIFTSQIFAQPWLDIMNNNAGTDLNAVRYSFNEYWQGRKEERGTGISLVLALEVTSEELVQKVGKQGQDQRPVRR